MQKDILGSKYNRARTAAFGPVAAVFECDGQVYAASGVIVLAQTSAGFFAQFHK